LELWSRDEEERGTKWREGETRRVSKCDVEDPICGSTRLLKCDDEQVNPSTADATRSRTVSVELVLHATPARGRSSKGGRRFPGGREEKALKAGILSFEGLADVWEVKSRGELRGPRSRRGEGGDDACGGLKKTTRQSRLRLSLSFFLLLGASSLSPSPSI